MSPNIENKCDDHHFISPVGYVQYSIALNLGRSYDVTLCADIPLGPGPILYSLFRPEIFTLLNIILFYLPPCSNVLM